MSSTWERKDNVESKKSKKSLIKPVRVISDSQSLYLKKRVVVFLEKIMIRDLLLLIVTGLAEHHPNT